MRHRDAGSPYRNVRAGKRGHASLCRGAASEAAQRRFRRHPVSRAGSEIAICPVLLRPFSFVRVLENQIALLQHGYAKREDAPMFRKPSGDSVTRNLRSLRLFSRRNPIQRQMPRQTHRKSTAHTRKILHRQLTTIARNALARNRQAQAQPRAIITTLREW